MFKVEDCFHYKVHCNWYFDELVKLFDCLKGCWMLFGECCAYELVMVDRAPGCNLASEVS